MSDVDVYILTFPLIQIVLFSAKKDFLSTITETDACDFIFRDERNAKTTFVDQSCLVTVLYKHFKGILFSEDNESTMKFKYLFDFSLISHIHTLQ